MITARTTHDYGGVERVIDIEPGEIGTTFSLNIRERTPATLSMELMDYTGFRFTGHIEDGDLIEVFENGTLIFEGYLTIIGTSESSLFIEAYDTSTLLGETIVGHIVYVDKPGEDIISGYTDDTMSANLSTSGTVKLVSTETTDTLKAMIYGTYNGFPLSEDMYLTGTTAVTSVKTYDEIRAVSLYDTATGTVSLTDSSDNALGTITIGNHVLAAKETKPVGAPATVKDNYGTGILYGTGIFANYPVRFFNYTTGSFVTKYEEPVSVLERITERGDVDPSTSKSEAWTFTYRNGYLDIFPRSYTVTDHGDENLKVEFEINAPTRNGVMIIGAKTKQTISSPLQEVIGMATVDDGKRFKAAVYTDSTIMNETDANQAAAAIASEKSVTEKLATITLIPRRMSWNLFDTVDAYDLLLKANEICVVYEIEHDLNADVSTMEIGTKRLEFTSVTSYSTMDSAVKLGSYATDSTASMAINDVSFENNIDTDFPLEVNFDVAMDSIPAVYLFMKGIPFEQSDAGAHAHSIQPTASVVTQSDYFTIDSTVSVADDHTNNIGSNVNTESHYFSSSTMATASHPHTVYYQKHDVASSGHTHSHAHTHGFSVSIGSSGAHGHSSVAGTAMALGSAHAHEVLGVYTATDGAHTHTVTASVASDSSSNHTHSGSGTTSSQSSSTTGQTLSHADAVYNITSSTSSQSPSVSGNTDSKSPGVTGTTGGASSTQGISGRTSSKSLGVTGTSETQTSNPGMEQSTNPYNVHVYLKYEDGSYTDLTTPLGGPWGNGSDPYECLGSDKLDLTDYCQYEGTYTLKFTTEQKGRTKGFIRMMY